MNLHDALFLNGWCRYTWMEYKMNLKYIQFTLHSIGMENIAFNIDIDF